MYISKFTAQEIVEEIGREIGENINLMDDHGVIIASTDKKRIGNIHEGAIQIMKERLPELYITEDMENEMTKKGINLPLVVEGEVVGVVGITGERAQVYGYGNIVRRMTEILIADSRQKDAKRYERRQRYHFLQEWLEYGGTNYSQEFLLRAKRMNIDLFKDYRVMVLMFPNHEILSDTFEGQSLLEQMEASIRHEADRRGILYLREPTRQICLLPWCEKETILKVAQRFIFLVEEKYHQKLTVGYDAGKENRRKEPMKNRAAEAEKAATQALRQGQVIVGYEQLGIEIFMHDISYNTMEEYLRNLFSSAENLEEEMQLIEMYLFCEGSIGKMAEKLYIHKNTVQYKLHRMAERTGKDIRLPSECADFVMALAFYRYMKA